MQPLSLCRYLVEKSRAFKALFFEKILKYDDVRWRILGYWSSFRNPKSPIRNQKY